MRVTKRLRDDEHVYGLGEKTGPLDKRGWQLGGSSVAMWNSDTYRYDQSTDPLYVSVPFYLVLRQGRAHAVFFDNSHRSSFDLGRSSRSRLSFGAEGGELDYYVIDGPSPRQVLERYTALTGRVPLPPLWALGYHQSRYSYFPDSRLRELARQFRERRIPADVLWLDIHALQDFRPFTWDAERFPDPARLLADLRAQGLRTVVIVDPHPKKQAGDPVYESGLAGGHFVRRADGSLFEGQVWPARAERTPGPSVFPDFSRAATRAWWGALYRPLLDLGLAGIWNDMNEPSVFDGPAGTLPLDARHDGDGLAADHAEIHNVYGQLMTRSTFEGLLRLRPDRRPFVLTRASFAGGQRFAAVWPGDSSSDWSHLKGSIPMLLGLGLSGFAFAGADVGGFSDDASPELLTRWLQLGALTPFFRNHSDLGTADQEPWAHGQPWEALNRRAIELRYELLPHVYTAMREASRTGVPAMRPLFVDFPQDEATWRLDDEFLFGSDLLVAPIVREGQRRREVYLPAGAWYDLWTGARLEGGRRVNVRSTPRTPAAVRARRGLRLSPARREPHRPDARPAADRGRLPGRALGGPALRGRRRVAGLPAGRVRRARLSPGARSRGLSRRRRGPERLLASGCARAAPAGASRGRAATRAPGRPRAAAARRGGAGRSRLVVGGRCRGGAPARHAGGDSGRHRPDMRRSAWPWPSRARPPSP